MTEPATQGSKVPSGHPPIPPNCPYFYGQDEFIVPERHHGKEDHWFIVIPHCSSYWRPIIAAVAVFYWDKESKRIGNLIDTETSFKERSFLRGELELADQHAAAWERWGEQG